MLIGGSVAVPHLGVAKTEYITQVGNPWSPKAVLASLRSLFPHTESQEQISPTGRIEAVTVALINGFAGRGDVWVENEVSEKEKFTIVGTKTVPVELAPDSDRAPDPIEVSVPASVTQTPTPPPPPPPPAPTAYGKLIIPAINVSAHIEAVGVDTKGNMGVPKDARNVAWYSGGVKPGEIGNAVIDGHYDTASGRAAVFFRLKQLRPGDTMRVDQPDGSSPTFVVDRVQTVSVSDAAAFQSVFGPADRAQLVLITCAGKWNQQARTYSERLLVFAHMEEQ